MYDVEEQDEHVEEDTSDPCLGFTLNEKDSKLHKSKEDAASTPQPNGNEKLPVVPPDGGWGWVIVFACFMCNSLVDGMCSVFGVFMPNLLDYFGESKGKTVMAGSLLAGGFMCSGPVASALVHCVGCRIVAMAGGLLSTAAFILSTFSPSVDVLIITYGVLGGLGLGLIYLPAMVMLGFYFEQRRALATGIATSGAGFGVLALAPLSAFLLNQFSWQNAMLLISGCVLQSVAMGALMRPLKSLGTPSECSTDYTGEEEENEKNETQETIVCRTSAVVSDSLCPLPEEEAKVQQLIPQEVMRPRSATVNSQFSFTTSKEESHHSLHRQAIENLLLSRNTEDSQNKGSSLIGGEKHGHQHISHRCGNGFKGTHVEIHSCLDLPVSHAPHIPARKGTQPHSKWWNAYKKGSTQVPRTPLSSDKPCVLSASCYELSSPSNPYKAVEAHMCRNQNSTKHHFARPISRMDIFFGGSALVLSKMSVDVKSNLSVISGNSRSLNQRCSCVPHLGNRLRLLCDTSVVKNPHFLIICFASIFIQIGYFIPIMFLSTYAISLDIESGKAAMLLSVIGISNTIGRAGAGGLANIPCVNYLHLNNLSLLTAGVATVLCGLFCKTFLALVIYAAVFGLFIASFVPLTTIFLVDYLGLERLTSAFGLLSMVRGIASMTGAPIAGMLMDATASYTATFCFAGSMFIFAGFIHYLLPLVGYLQDKRSDNHDNKPTTSPL